jgi:RNA polymerase primary sigma factor
MRAIKITQKITSRESQSLDKYLNEISKMSMITPEDEAMLARRIREGDEIALEKLVKANLRFVVSVAKQYQQNGMTLGDLINEGNLGLIKAASRFDESRGFKFISYAVWWIRQSIMQALSEQSRIVRLPLNRVGSLNKVSKTFSELEQKFQREPTHEELAEVMETTPEEINKLASYKGRHVSMDAPLGSDNDAGTMLDVMADESSTKPDADLMNVSLKKEIQSSLRKLTIREADVLSLYYGLSGGHALSLHDIGEKFELSPERVRQIKEKATRKLRKTSSLNVLKSYLG